MSKSVCRTPLGDVLPQGERAQKAQALFSFCISQVSLLWGPDTETVVGIRIPGEGEDVGREEAFMAFVWRKDDLSTL